MFFRFWGGGILKLSDLDSLTIFILGGILKLLDLDSLTIFIFGGYSETLGFGLSDNFHFWGGILKLSDLDSLTIFIFWGGILKLSNLDSLTIFIFGGGYSETLRFGLSDNFHLGGYSETVLQNRGYSGRIWTKISTTPAGSCITDSLSHTTHVETKKTRMLVIVS